MRRSVCRASRFDAPRGQAHALRDEAEQEEDEDDGPQGRGAHDAEEGAGALGSQRVGQQRHEAAGPPKVFMSGRRAVECEGIGGVEAAGLPESAATDALGGQPGVVSRGSFFVRRPRLLPTAGAGLPEKGGI